MLFVLWIGKEITQSIAVDTKVNDKHTVTIRFTTINKSLIKLLVAYIPYLAYMVFVKTMLDLLWERSFHDHYARLIGPIVKAHQ